MGRFKTSHSVWQHQVTLLSLKTLSKTFLVSGIDFSFHVPSHRSANYQGVITCAPPPHHSQYAHEISLLVRRAQKIFLGNSHQPMEAFPIHI